MAKGNDVLTMGNVAKICKVCSRTAQKWFDKGLLKGYRGARTDGYRYRN